MRNWDQHHSRCPGPPENFLDADKSNRACFRVYGVKPTINDKGGIDIMKRKWNRQWALGLALALGLAAAASARADAAGALSLYTPYPAITVTPGESIQYNVDLINNGSAIESAELEVEHLPAKWESEITADGWSVQTIAVKPKDSRSVTLQVDVPLDVNKGTYRFELSAKGKAVLPLTVTVSQQGSFKTELTSEQPNMEGPADSQFQYSATLRNRTAQKQLYSLTAQAPEGWDVQFKADGKAVTSVQVDANGSKDIDVEIRPPKKVKSGSYKIPVKAATSSTSAQLELEAVITGTYGLEVSTPTGVLSTDVTAGGTRTLQLKVTNTGTADLRNVELSASTPVNWEVTFEPKRIDKLAAGQKADVTATIKADSKAIAGDYVVNVSATAPEASADAEFRVAVETSVLWGWLGVLVILAVAGGVTYLFRTYGRR
jgi:uncharacterized membrane protein